MAISEAGVEHRMKPSFNSLVERGHPVRSPPVWPQGEQGRSVLSIEAIRSLAVAIRPRKIIENQIALACFVAATIGFISIATIYDTLSWVNDQRVRWAAYFSGQENLMEVQSNASKALANLHAKPPEREAPIDPNLLAAVASAEKQERKSEALSSIRTDLSDGHSPVQRQTEDCMKLLYWAADVSGGLRDHSQRSRQDVQNTVNQRLLWRSVQAAILIGAVLYLTFMLNHYRTMRNRAEAQLVEAQLRRQEIFQMVTHDLQTPLSTLKGFLTIVATGNYGSLSQRGLELLRSAEASAQQMTRLIQDLLDMERLDAGMLTLSVDKLQLSEVFEDCMSLVSHMARQRKITIAMEDGDISVSADGARLVQVLTNLLSNAIKFSPDGSLVTLKAVERDNVVMIEVSDHGRGIPDHLIGSIFDRFKQVDVKDATVSNGKGLGLAISKALVELHGGEIRASSDRDAGTTFSVRLPSTPRTSS